MDHLHDEELVVLYLKKDDEAYLTELFRRYLPLIYGFSRQYVGSSEKASDIAQETCIKAWRNLKSFDTTRSFKSWIFTVAKHTALDWLRKKEATPFSAFDNKETYGVIGQIEDGNPHADIIFDQKLASGKVTALLHSLREEYRSVLTMHINDGMTFQEIAKYKNESINTVKSRYRRAIESLKQKMEEAGNFS